nr:hypothetical protein [Tanacetum cinerariifolium]
MDLFAFIHVTDPTKVRVVERERAEGEPWVLETTFGRTVLLLLIALDRADSDLEASVNRLFDKGGSGAGGEQEAGTAARVRIVSGEDVVVEEPRRLRKKRQAATDVGGSSHPPKKLRSDYIAPSVAPSAGKSPSSLMDLLAKSMLNVESGAEVAATLPCVTSSISATPDYDSGVPTAPERFVISLYSSYHSANASKAEGSSIIRSDVIPPMVTEAVITTQVSSIPSTAALEPSTKVVTPVHAPMFQYSDSSRTVRPDVVSSSHAPGKELSLGLDASQEFIDHMVPLVLFAQIRDMDYEELFTVFSVGTARQAYLSAELRMRTEFYLSERRRLESQLGKQDDLLKSKDEEIEDLKARLLLKEVEAAEAIHLRAEASNLEAVEKSLRGEVTALKGRNAILEKERDALDGKRLEEFQDAQLKVVNYKLEKLYADFMDMALHLEEKLYPYQLTTISGRRWLLTHGMELVVTKCLHSSEYLSALGAAIGKAIEKEMQDGLAAEKTHGAEGRTLADVATYNPSAEANYVSALQRLQNINFSLLVKLRSSKDASVDTIMSILRLEDNLVERLVLTESQPCIDQLMVPIHHSLDRVVVGATSGTSNTMHAPITAALSTTLAFANTIAPIIVNDYGVVGMDDRTGADADPFPNCGAEYALVLC